MAANPEGARDAERTLRVQIASDLHLEFYETLPAFHHFLEPSAPVLALLGDISALGHRRGVKLYEEFLAECCKHFQMVLVLAGNHEFYSDDVSIVSVQEILSYLRRLHVNFPRVRFLENEGVLINGVRVSGTVLWSEVPHEQTIDGARSAGRDAGSCVEFCMNDYRLIYVDEDDVGADAGHDAVPAQMGASADFGSALPLDALRRFASAPGGGSSRTNPRKRCAQVEDTNSWFRSGLAFLTAEAEKATTKRANMLVLTHHTPSFNGTSDPRYGSDPTGTSSAFSTDLEHLFKTPETAAIHTWCFGHTHYNSDQTRSAVRLVSNQRGYSDQLSPGYRRDLVVEIPTAYMGDRQRSAPGKPEERTIQEEPHQPMYFSSRVNLSSLGLGGLA